MHTHFSFRFFLFFFVFLVLFLFSRWHRRHHCASRNIEWIFITFSFILWIIPSMCFVFTFVFRVRPFSNTFFQLLVLLLLSESKCSTFLLSRCACHKFLLLRTEIIFNSNEADSTFSLKEAGDADFVHNSNLSAFKYTVMVVTVSAKCCEVRSAKCITIFAFRISQKNGNRRRQCDTSGSTKRQKRKNGKPWQAATERRFGTTK